jgi:hypothetical protein
MSEALSRETACLPFSVFGAHSEPIGESHR